VSLDPLGHRVLLVYKGRLVKPALRAIKGLLVSRV
jgi:hypothetical protein